MDMRRLINLVEGADFNAWFGDSKVVNNHGQPLICWHSTYADFDPRHFHPLSHFGSEDAAKDRMNSLYADDEGARYHRVYLKIINPLKIDDEDMEHTPWNLLRSINDLYGFIDDDEVDELDGASKQEVAAFVISMLNDNGYDGVCYENTHEGNREMSWIITGSSQVWPVNP
jgi:hypothetical protein